MKIITIVGARPQFIKAAVVSRSLAKAPGVEEHIHTGQHFDAIERNRQAMREVFGIEETVLPETATRPAFAQQLVVKVWNGDMERPLFTNYWSGAKGWYRVAYDNGTSQCREGTPPFGLTNSFPTGGYASWAPHAPEIRILGRRLYE